jgi:ABC-type antimicrobial peptide transport system permease subunit
VIATVLSAMGLYSVTAYGVAQRTVEIGIRMALGAQRSQVAWLFLRRTLLQLALGLAIGLAGAIGVGQLIRGLLVRTSAADPLTFAAIVIVLVAVTAAACSIPARRATRLDPAAALRCEQRPFAI